MDFWNDKKFLCKTFSNNKKLNYIHSYSKITSIIFNSQSLRSYHKSALFQYYLNHIYLFFFFKNANYLTAWNYLFMNNAMLKICNSSKLIIYSSTFQIEE